MKVKLFPQKNKLINVRWTHKITKPSISSSGNSVYKDHMIQIDKTCINDIQV